MPGLSLPDALSPAASGLVSPHSFPSGRAKSLGWPTLFFARRRRRWRSVGSVIRSAATLSAPAPATEYQPDAECTSAAPSQQLSHSHSPSELSYNDSPSELSYSAAPSEKCRTVTLVVNCRIVLPPASNCLTVILTTNCRVVPLPANQCATVTLPANCRIVPLPANICRTPFYFELRTYYKNQTNASRKRTTALRAWGSGNEPGLNIDTLVQSIYKYIS